MISQITYNHSLDMVIERIRKTMSPLSICIDKQACL
uniref:Uncharacterized protein n=1 Tax=Arundo donax TaxID=35708 RepID=A0A0A9FXB9_ARUDO